ncbi:hypothetical protein QJS04_geneDACA012108 [Acorus gramineus]|uniref:Prolamin-like domain-containing protein n=1 Tax=Acorus gramineus TaxID=55184 RepID=A0AAV9BB77_ACOGR|nr:hypothetical protein QJS04_geneDACA012108 [Acorus gramineus]
MKVAGAMSMTVLVLVLACTVTALAHPLTSGEGVVDESKTFGCWQALIGAKGCIQDIFSSFFSGRIRLSPQCCHAIESITQDCFLMFFPFLDPSFNPLLKASCAAAPPPKV